MVRQIASQLLSSDAPSRFCCTKHALFCGVQDIFLKSSQFPCTWHIISLPCLMYERRRLHELSTGNLFCSPPVLPFRPGFFRPIERYHRSTVSSDHLVDVFRAWCPAWCLSLNSRVSLCDWSISVCMISLVPTGPCLGLPFVKPPRSSHVQRKRCAFHACNIASQTPLHSRIVQCPCLPAVSDDRPNQCFDESSF